MCGTTKNGRRVHEKGTITTFSLQILQIQGIQFTPMWFLQKISNSISRKGIYGKATCRDSPCKEALKMAKRSPASDHSKDQINFPLRGHYLGFSISNIQTFRHIYRCDKIVTLFITYTPVKYPGVSLGTPVLCKVSIYLYKRYFVIHLNRLEKQTQAYFRSSIYQF